MEEKYEEGMIKGAIDSINLEKNRENIRTNEKIYLQSIWK